MARSPSAWGMLVYRDTTSIVKRKRFWQAGGKVKELRVVRVWLVSLRKEGREETIGWKTRSRYWEICSVGQEQVETIGRPGVEKESKGGLWILGSR